MSLNVTVTGVKTLPFVSSDMRYPVFRFVQSFVVTGDATGGNVFVFVTLRPSGQALSGQTWGVRHVIGTVEGSGIGDLIVLAQRFSMTETPAEDEVVTIAALPVTVSGIRSSWNVLNADIILGRASTLAASSALQFLWETNTDGLSYRGYVEGFIWLPGALYSGGPLFPGEFPPPL